MDLSLADVNSEEQQPNETISNPLASTCNNDQNDRESIYMEIDPEDKEDDDKTSPDKIEECITSQASVRDYPNV